MAADLLSSCLTSNVMGEQEKIPNTLRFSEFLGRIKVRASRAVYILKSKFGCRFAESNLSYCHVNVAGDGQPLDSLVSLCSHFGIANKHREMF